MKQLWKRTTAAADGSRLRPDLLAAVRDHAERVGADDPSGQVTSACVTASESLERRRLFRRAPESHDTYLLLAAPVLVVVVDRPGSAIVSIYRLGEIELAPFRSTLVEDPGLSLTGVAIGGTERGQRYLPLDDRADAAAFRAALLEAARSVRG